MRSIPLTLLCVLLMSSAVAVLVNKMRPTQMAWMRAPRPTPPPPVPDPSKTDPSQSKATSQPVTPSPTPTPTPATPPAQQPNSIGTVTADVVLTFLQDGKTHFVDAREDHEWVEGHLRGAIHIPASAIYENISRIVQQAPPSEKVIVYCGGGQCEASHHVADALSNDFKFTDVSIYTKGWEEIEKVEGFRPFIAKGNEP